MIAPEVSIILISYNSIRLTRQALASIQEFCPEAEIIIVDNASQDGSADCIESEFPNVTLIRSEENIGFGRANNLAAKVAKGRFLFLVNTDTWMLSNTAKILSKYLLQNDHVAACSPQQFQENLKPQVIGGSFPSIFTLLWDHLHLWRITPKSISRRFQVLCTHQSSSPMAYDYLMGSALMIRREIWDRLGGFDPRFFFYYEETDLCYRIRNEGKEIHLVPNATMVHLHGGSTGGRSGRESVAAFERLRIGERIFFTKNHGEGYWRVYRLIAMTLNFLKASLTRKISLWNNYIAYAKVK